MQSAWACFISLMFVLVGGWLPTAWCWFPLHSSMNQPCPPRSWASAPPRPVPRRHRAPAEPRVTRQPPTSSPFHTRSCIHVTATLSVLPRLLPPLGRVQSLHVRLFCTFLVVEGSAYDRLQASRKMLRTDLFFSRCCLSGCRPACASSSAERGGSSEPPQAPRFGLQSWWDIGRVWDRNGTLRRLPCPPSCGSGSLAPRYRVFAEWRLHSGRDAQCLLSPCSRRGLSWPPKLRHMFMLQKIVKRSLTSSFQFLFACFQILISNFQLSPVGHIFHPFCLTCPGF